MIENFQVRSYLHNYSHYSFSKINLTLQELFKEENLDLIVIDKLVFDKFSELKQIKDKNLHLIDVNTETKSIKNLTNILEIFSNNNLKKSSLVAVIGGGTLQDIVASACCMYFRGLKWIFLPTTALSQGDSCVGSKTSIDSETSKNQYGLFYPPIKIFVCKEFLKTLNFLELISGFGDMLHYLLPYEEGYLGLEALLKSLNDKDLLIDLAEDLAKKAMFVKARMVEVDEFDTYERYIFNYGHTFGHALEKSSDKYLPHGIGVLLGVIAAISLSKINEELLPQKESIKKLINKLIDLGYLKNLNFSVKNLSSQLMKDKKNDKTGLIKCIVPCITEETTWSYNGFEKKYGLMISNFKIRECLEAILKIDEISSISFVN